MSYGWITLSIGAILLAGCGLTPIQKQQVAQFATATESVAVSTQDQFKSTRDKVIELEKRRLILRRVPPPKSLDLDGGLSATGIAAQISTLKALQAYGDILNKLATNDQTAAISKAATTFMSQFEAARKNQEASYSLDSDKKNAALGVVNIVGSWFVEYEKKKHLKTIVEAYSRDITQLAKVLRNDLTLAEDSLCIDAKSRTERKSRTGVIDIYCTSADGLREIASDVLNNANNSFSEREFAYNSYFLADQAIEEIRTLSDRGGKIVSKLTAANDQLLQVIESDNYSTDDIKAYAQQVDELGTLIKVLVGKQETR